MILHIISESFALSILTKGDIAMLKKLVKKSLFCLALLAISCVYCEEPVKEIKVLTIGNSFANSVFAYLPQIVNSVPGCKLTLVGANHGGCSLERHWKYVEEEEANPDTKWYSRKTMKLRELLQSQKWDIVTIQQVSTSSWKPETFQPCAENLRKYVNKHCPTAEVVLQQTWAYRTDSPNLGENGHWKITQKQMIDRITGAYQECSSQMKLRVIPSGLAVQIARDEQPGKFQPVPKEELKKLKYPELPDEKWSLCAGNRWRKNKKTEQMTLALDPSHLNARGQYLQACTWFAFLFNKNTKEISFIPKNFDPKDAEFLRNCAQKAVEQGATTFQVKK